MTSAPSTEIAASVASSVSQLTSTMPSSPSEQSALAGTSNDLIDRPSPLPVAHAAANKTSDANPAVTFQRMSCPPYSSNLGTLVEPVERRAGGGQAGGVGRATGEGRSLSASMSRRRRAQLRRSTRNESRR